MVACMAGNPMWTTSVFNAPATANNQQILAGKVTLRKPDEYEAEADNDANAQVPNYADKDANEILEKRLYPNIFDLDQSDDNETPNIKMVEKEQKAKSVGPTITFVTIKPKLESNTKPKPEAKSKSDAKTKSKPETKSQAKLDSKPKLRSDAKPKPTQEAKTKSETKSKAKPDAKPRPQPPKITTRRVAKTNAKQEVKTKPKPETKDKSDTKTKSKPDPKTKPETKTKAKPETKTKIEPKTNPKKRMIINLETITKIQLGA
ncbi:hypothetical protein E8E15_009390 [Penicillium rubens]|uniref:Pc22g14660 protein n=2 Tax=Penicillium chrysogenum species complex TaxID=254878 RepID=B6HV03_PENRW|nr:uncharacterized protein N7525_004906 [Penicillium rubens]KAF3027448.1 hypothetical protein E8E15_009390 [Penicillium rubens]KAJ5839718.1 hypothetical protein N7525_004906 [Penicillium rubens]CAP98754.1 Pc22g14660 [Penicillium rubens Wisconsin 54-1255]